MELELKLKDLTLDQLDAITNAEDNARFKSLVAQLVKVHICSGTTKEELITDLSKLA